MHNHILCSPLDPVILSSLSTFCKLHPSYPCQYILDASLLSVSASDPTPNAWSGSCLPLPVCAGLQGTPSPTALPACAASSSLELWDRGEENPRWEDKKSRTAELNYARQTPTGRPEMRRQHMQGEL